jgi:hypothetical protein
MNAAARYRSKRSSLPSENIRDRPNPSFRTDPSADKTPAFRQNP